MTTNDGYVIRHHYLKPSVKVGDRVKAGETNIGTVQSLKKAYEKATAGGMPNHMHFEAYDMKTEENNDGKGIKKMRRIDPTPFLWSGE